MTEGSVTFVNATVFDGTDLHAGCNIETSGGRVSHFGPSQNVAPTGRIVDLEGDIVSPGFVDLQVNGGGGAMFNDEPTVETLRIIAEAHRQLGVRALLPTLITDDRDRTRAAIAAATEAIARNVPGIAGLHLEGPHLSIARKGAHDADLIRPMDASDLDQLLAAADALPVLMVTIAPENTTAEQVAALSRAGVVVSLGHTDADFETCGRYFAAGAKSATHLFNAMSQLGNREPGLVGAALATGAASAGLIADGIHVHPASIRTAWAAKQGPGQIFLVSDAMAVAGSALAEFRLGGRVIKRQNGRLTLADGTLAGADLDLVSAVRTLTRDVGIDVATALGAATTVPARLAGLPVPDQRLRDVALSDIIRIRPDFSRVSRLDL